MAIQTRLEDMVIGDKIIAQADARSGGSINFTYLGTSTLGPHNDTLPFGNYSLSFYWIYVGKDFKGRMIFVANKNVFHSVSWDQLNTWGYATKDGTPITSLGLDPTKWKTNIRLLTGGTSSTTTTNSEWNQYIVNGTGGGQYTAGDNAVWNWSGSILTLTSSTPSATGGTSYKAVRGSNTITTYTSVLTNTSNNTTGFRPVLVAELLVQPNNPPTFTGGLSTDSVHFESVSLTGDITDETTVIHRLLVNGTEYSPFTSFAAAPVSVNYSVPYTALNVGSNNIVLEIKDDKGALVTQSFSVNRLNYTPTFDNVTLDHTSVHLEDVLITGTLNDAEGDNVKYRVLVNGTETIPWSIPAPPPVSVNFMVSHSLLNIGSNTVVVELNDGINTGSWTGNISVVDIQPEITLDFQGLTVRATLSDTDSDMLQYRMTLNGVQKYPDSGWTEFKAPPIEIVKTFPSSEVNIGSSNTLTIEVRDNFTNSVFSKSVTFIGEYSGIMFEDGQGNYYSTDTGSILDYLTFDTVVAGTSSSPVPVYVRNKNGFKVTNVRLNKLNEVLPPGAFVEISKEAYPFNSESSLLFTDILNYGERLAFYVRIRVTDDAEPGDGGFDLNVTANPVE